MDLPTMARLALLALVLSVASACEGDLRPIYQVPCGIEGRPCGTSGNGWGDFTASLSVPACTGDMRIVVNTTLHELSGTEAVASPGEAGATLSFVEALWIASNMPGRQVVEFDPAVFPVDAPATILIDTLAISVPNILDDCVDARGRGVRLEWTPALQSCGSCSLKLRDNAVVVGLELLRIPNQIRMTGTGAQLAGCRINTDGVTHYSGLGIRGWGCVTLGPGNAGAFGLDLGTLSCAQATIVDNYFGRDPVTGGELSERSTVLSLAGGTSYQIEGNLFGPDAALSVNGASLSMRENVFEPSSLTSSAISVRRSLGTDIGPGNVISGRATAISILDSVMPHATITRNSLFGNGTAISIDVPPADPPVVSAATTAGAQGTCAVAGLVEVFHDAADQAETYVGSASCDPGTGWDLGAPLPAGRNATATLTTDEGATTELSAPRAIEP